jgi:CBS domain-containing protein
MTLTLDRDFPIVKARRVPTIKATTPTLDAISMLLASKLEALPIVSAKDSTTKDTTRAKAISGYSLISKLTFESDRLGSILEEPCENSALTVGVVSLLRDDLISLLQVFEATTFGYAAADTSQSNQDRGSLIFIYDLLDLYMTGRLSSDLSVGDVASSPIFSVKRTSTLREILREMLVRKFRRALVKGTENEIITDRKILEFLFAGRNITPGPSFDAGSLEIALDNTAEMIEPVLASKVSSHENLGRVAQLMMESRNWFVVSPSGLVTPWDLIVKPLATGSSFNQKLKQLPSRISLFRG